MKLVNIVGARPQFIKLAPLERAIAEHNTGDTQPVESIIIHTGQHYDTGMSDIFFDELKIPRAHFHLDVGSGRHGDQTARMLQKIEEILLDTSPDMVVTYGDTNSTLAGALAASKLQIPVAHVEAGLRSFDRQMPEEINRLVADHVSDLLLAPTPTAIRNLEKENLSTRTVFTGDIMYDAVLFNRKLAKQQSSILKKLWLEPGTFGLVTVHRASNTDEKGRLKRLLQALNEVAAQGLPLVFPVHPRTAKSLKSKYANWSAHPQLHLVEPLGYLDILLLLDSAKMALTDSGGLQKEAFFLGCPCITLREQTEWVETVEAGGNLLTGTDPEKILGAVSRWQQYASGGAAGFSQEASRYFGDGDAASAILNALFQYAGRMTA
ncbi:MAG: UDP-N-acetylglucosamine 2-epimerase (non-hydrolyzing) [Pseudomonadota bacterium]